MGSRPEISIVTPVYNEEDVINVFLKAVVPILSALSEDFEILFINDGSTDNTLAMIAEANGRDSRIRGIDLSRNFGKEAAMTAGLDHARGLAVIPIDVDLQDPPELIPQLIAKWREGFEVVLARRIDRTSDSWAKRHTSWLFYTTIDRLSDIRIPSNVGDFRLMDRKVVDALMRLPERTRFMKGIFAWLGFRQTEITYTRPIRVAGQTKWKPRALMRLVLEGIVSFSSFPLKIASYVGSFCALGSFVYGMYIIAKTLILGIDLPGYASLMTVTMFLNGTILLSLGVVGEYISRIFVEVKERPIYLVRDYVGTAI